jgi:hypothetical protein
MWNGVIGGLLLALVATVTGAASRGECVAACVDTIARCGTVCGAFADFDATCRRGVLKRCRREGPQVCTAGPPTTTPTTTPVTTTTRTATTTRPTTTSTTAPAGLSCATPRPLAIGATESSDTSNAYDHGPGVGCMQNAEAPDLIYAVTPPADGTLVLSIFSEWDAGLYVRTACEDAATEQSCVDQGGNNATEVLRLGVTAGTTYFVYVDGYTTESFGPFDLTTAFE